MNAIFVDLNFEPKTVRELINFIANRDGVQVSHPYNKKFLRSGYFIEMNTDKFISFDSKRFYTLMHEHYKSFYDNKLRMPLISYANFDYTKRSKTELSNERCFTYDPLVQEDKQIGPSFYEGDEFDKGHLTRRTAIDWGDKIDEAVNAQLQSDYYTNVVAQYSKFNRGVWRQVENACTEVAKKHVKIIEITGVWFANFDEPSTFDENSNKTDKRPVADAFWKCCVFVSESEMTVCYFVPHSKDYPERVDVEEFRVTLKQLNAKLGYNLSKLWRFSMK